MSALFADTFYWIALADYKDDAHQRALSLAEERADATIITTDEVLAEYLTYFFGGFEIGAQRNCRDCPGHSDKSSDARDSAKPRVFPGGS